MVEKALDFQQLANERVVMLKYVFSSVQGFSLHLVLTSFKSTAIMNLQTNSTIRGALKTEGQQKDENQRYFVVQRNVFKKKKKKRDNQGKKERIILRKLRIVIDCRAPLHTHQTEAEYLDAVPVIAGFTNVLHNKHRRMDLGVLKELIGE